MGLEEKRKGKFKAAGRFVERIKKIQKEAKAVLGKVQEKIKRYTDRKWEKTKKYKVENLVLLSIKDLKWKMVERKLEKLTEQFVEPYKVKRIVSTNTIELELSGLIKINLVANISWVWLYRP